MKSFAHIDDETRISNFRVILTVSVPFIVTFAVLANISKHHINHKVNNKLTFREKQIPSFQYSSDLNSTLGINPR